MADTETETETEDGDGALEALETLSEVTTSSIEGLSEVNARLDSARKRRGEGWSWQRIVSSTDLAGSMGALVSIAADLGRASGEFRRSLAHVLRAEGLRLTEIGRFMDVSRQRVSALLRPRAHEYPSTLGGNGELSSPGWAPTQPSGER